MSNPPRHPGAWLATGASNLVLATVMAATGAARESGQADSSLGRSPESSSARKATPAVPPATPAAGSAVRYEALSVEGDLFVHERFRTQKLGERRVFVFLPSEYEMFDERRYPVLYLLDGQNYFDADLAAGGEEWALDELLVRHPDGVPEMVVVGVQAGPQAVLEFSPPGSSAEARGDEYIAFLADELKPFVDAHYRTKPQRASTLIAGQGSSAVLALYAAWVRGDVFAGAIALDFPDVDSQTTAWSAQAPPSGRPWLWLEQSWSERARVSTTDLVAALRQHAEMQVVMTGQEASRARRLLAALQAMPLR